MSSASSTWSSPDESSKPKASLKAKKLPTNINIRKLPYHKRPPTRITTCSIPKEKYDYALAQLMKPRSKPRPVRRASRKDEKLCDPDGHEHEHHDGDCPTTKTESSNVTETIMRRCSRMLHRTVHGSYDDTRTDNYQPTDLTAMLCNISYCIRNEDWKNAVLLLELAAKRKQTHHSRFALYRLAYIMFLYNPVLKGSGLLESFVQGVFDCRNDAEVQNFIKQSTTTPATTLAGYLNTSDLQRSHSDQQRLLTLTAKSESDENVASLNRYNEDSEDEGDLEAKIQQNINHNVAPQCIIAAVTEDKEYSGEMDYKPVILKRKIHNDAEVNTQPNKIKRLRKK